MTPDQLLDDVCSPDPARVAAALQTAGSQRAELAPLLLARLTDAATRPAAWLGPGEKNPVFLCYLAAAWLESAAHLPIVKLFRLPAREADALLGDFITEDGSTVLADTCEGDLAPLHALVADTAADPFARGAGLDALARLVARGRHNREALLESLRQLAATLDPEREDDVCMGNGIIDVALELRAWELRGLALGLYDRGLADTMFISPEEVAAELVPGRLFDPAAGKLSATITDAWVAVKDWHFFAPLRFPRSTRREKIRPPPRPMPAPASAHPGEAFSDDLPQPYLAPPKPGRNDPCSCGSGKKFKKCCGA